MTSAVRETLFWILFWMAPMILVVGVCYFFLSMPARRNERARLFLDLLETGLQLDAALEKTPNLLPTAVAATVKIGVAEGTLDKMLPAARGMLDDATSRLRGALNHLVLFALVIVPAGLFLMPMLSQFIWPKFQ